MSDLERAQMIYNGAKKALGADLKGYSLLDLLADNMELPLSTLRELAEKVER